MCLNGDFIVGAWPKLSAVVNTLNGNNYPSLPAVPARLGKDLTLSLAHWSPAALQTYCALAISNPNLLTLQVQIGIWRYEVAGPHVPSYCRPTVSVCDFPGKCLSYQALKEMVTLKNWPTIRPRGNHFPKEIMQNTQEELLIFSGVRKNKDIKQEDDFGDILAFAVQTSSQESSFSNYNSTSMIPEFFQPQDRLHVFRYS